MRVENGDGGREVAFPDRLEHLAMLLERHLGVPRLDREMGAQRRDFADVVIRQVADREQLFATGTHWHGSLVPK